MKYISLIALLALGCQDKPGSDPKAPGSGPAVSGAQSAGSTASTAPKIANGASNALVTAKATLAKVPAQAEMLVLTANIGALFDALGREEVIKAIPSQYNRIATQIRREIGVDLLDPAQWKTIGINPDGPCGLFVIARSVTAGFMVTLSDAKAFNTWLKGKAPADKILEVKGATVYLGGYSPTLVVKGDTLYLMTADRGFFGEAWGLAIAEMDGKPTLADDSRILKSAQALGFGQHVAGFIDTQRVVDNLIAAEMRQPDAELPKLIAIARGAGRTRLVERLERRQNRRSRGMGKAVAAGAVKGMIVGGIGPMSFGVEVEGAAVRLKANLEATANALPRRLFKPRKSAGAIATLAGPKAALMADAHVDTAQAMAMLNTMMLTTGDEFAEIEHGMRQEFGLDLRTQIIPAFTGEVGGSMLIQDPEAQGEKVMGTTLFASVDPAKYQVIMDALLKHPQLSKMLTRNGERYSLATPWRTISVERKETQLVITTEPTAIDRSPGRATPKHLAPSLSALMGRAGTAATWAMDIAPISGFWLLSHSGWEMPAPQVNADTPQIKMLLQKRAELSKQLTAAKAAMRKTQHTTTTAMLSPLGHTALVIDETDTGLTFEGGLFTRGPYLKAIASFAQQAVTIDQRMREARKPVRDLEDQRDAIDETLRNPALQKAAPAPAPKERLK